MLGFFRRHQKSFMLIFLVPGLIAMGITGAILAVLQGNPADVYMGSIFGERLHAQSFDRERSLYRITNPRNEEEEAWRFLAFLRAGEKSGLAVSDDEIRDSIHTEMKWVIAQYRALEAMDKEGLDRRGPQSQRQFQQKFFEELGKIDEEDFDIDEYKRILGERYGVNHRVFEEQQRRELVVRKLLDTFRELATVDPAEIAEAYQEKHHRRTLELAVIPAASYVPKADAKAGEPGFVTKDQVKAFYEAREVDFDIPRRVDLDYIAFPFEDAESELEAPETEALEAYNRWRGIVDVNSFSEAEDKVREAWFADEAKKRAMDVMEKVEDAAAAARKKTPEGLLDLAAIAKDVRSATGAKALLNGSTGKIELNELTEKDRSFLSGLAADTWFRDRDAGKVSAVLGNASGLYLLQSREVEHARTPRFEDIEAQVREGYINGTDAELRQHYQAHKNVDYRQDLSYRVEYALYKDAAFEGDHAKAKEALDATRAAISEQISKKSGAWKDGRRFPLHLLSTDTAIKPAMEVPSEFEPVTTADLEKHEVLAKVATAVPTATRWKLHEVEFEGGWGLYRVTKQLPVKVRPFDEVKDQVRQDVREERGLERASEAADGLLEEIAHETGDALQAKLKELGLTLLTTEAFDRDAVSLKDVPNAGQLVGEAFAAGVEVGGPFSRIVPDPDGKRVFLLRVASRVEAPQEGYRDAYPELREDLLGKRKNEFAEERIRKLLSDAKGLTSEHLAYARSMRDGPEGITRIKLRQIFVPPDETITGDWLKQAARTRAQEALDALSKGETWSGIVGRFSEHDATRGRAGRLPAATKADLVESFGNEFAEAAFRLAKDAKPEMIESIQGVHLVQMIEDQSDRRVFQHLLIKTDAERRKLPAEVTQKAHDAAKETLKKALAALDAGEPFAKVAAEYGAAQDPYGQGQELEMDYVTPLERAALSQRLEWELPPELSGTEDSAGWVPDVVTVNGPQGTTYHLFACARDARDTQAAWEDIPRRDRQVYHIQTNDPGRAQAARQELVDFVQESLQSEGDRPSWNQILDKFREVAAVHSTAPDKAKGGAFGLVRLEQAVRGYGDAFLAKVTADGLKPVSAGYTTGLFEGEAGYHLVEVVDVTTATADDAKRQGEVTQLVLDGTGWK